MNMTIQTPMARPPIVIRLLAHDLRWQLVSALARSDRRAQELVAILGQPANLVSYHLNKLRQAKLVHNRHSAADHRAIYFSLDLPVVQSLFAQAGRALHPAVGETSGALRTEIRDQLAQTNQPPTRLLFLCTHNSARSQMAEAIVRRVSKVSVEVFSAGTEPTELHPLAIQVMEERGIPIRGQHSKHLSEFVDQHFDYIITTCDIAREACPTFPGDPEQIHWSFADPAAVQGAEARLRAFKIVATELTTRINYLLLLISVERGKQRSQGSAATHMD
jgi:protein-tyrosine-phosphatase/DNA-binding transcriptional ArsR family regulator